MRGRSVDIVGHGCAGDEPEPLAHKLPTTMMTFDLPMTLAACVPVAEAAHSTGMGERRSREDAESVGSPAT